MKKLFIELDEDAIKATPFRPGDTFTGRVNFNTSAILKYTCIKVRFVGLVSTKVAKTIEEVYVLNQQTVLLGNPNNATTSVLDEGKHSWPFHFAVPLQHLPSSGKYRHGTVKYTLTAVVTSTKFLGGVQDIKFNKSIDLVDHVHDANYSRPVSIVGSSNTKLYTNNDRHLATASVSIPRSAYRPGQVLTLAVDLAHPQKIRRDPGCWIQLIRKEYYSAKDQVKEYSHVIAASAHAIKLESGSNTGKILAEITLPVDALPTMDTTKIISIQYHILFLFDMRSQTGFFERKSKKNVNQKLRKKILDSPGGFEVDLPIIMDIVSESRPPLEMSLEYQSSMTDSTTESGRNSFYSNPYDSIVVSTNQLTITAAPAPPVQDYFPSPVISPSKSSSAFPIPSPSPPQYPISSTSILSTSLPSPPPTTPPVTRIQDPFSLVTKPYVPQTKYVRTVPPRYSTLMPSFRLRGGETSQSAIQEQGVQSSRSHTLPIQLSHPSSPFRASAPLLTDNDLLSKPLPSVPGSAETTLSPSISTVQHDFSQGSISPSSTTFAPYSSANEPRTPRISASTSSLNNSEQRQSPPTHSYRLGSSSSNLYGYPPEKNSPIPDDSLYFPRPVAGAVQQNATAPSAVDLGVAPMSPPATHGYISPPTSYGYTSPPSMESPPSSFAIISTPPLPAITPAAHNYWSFTSPPRQQLPPQPTLFRYNPMASASAPRLYSPDFSQATEPVPAIPWNASNTPSIPPRPPVGVLQSDQLNRYKLTEQPSPKPKSPHTH